MTEHTDRHVPDPEFRARLEWQVASALRRESRFAAPIRSGGWRRLRMAALLLVTLGLGAMGGAASAQVQDARYKALLLASVRSEVALAELRMRLAEEAYVDAQRRVALGIVPRAELRDYEARRAAARAALQRAVLDTEEIQASGAEPATDLTAPRVDGRDFVGERLRVELATAATTLESASGAMQEAERRVRLGLEPELAVLQARLDLVRARNEFALLQVRQELRDRFLDREITAEALGPELRRQELRLEIEAAGVAYELARRRQELIGQQVRTGLATERERLQAELEVVERQSDLERLQLELGRIGGAGGEAA